MFTYWLNGLRKQHKYQTLVGACAILWAIWLTRNDITFNCARVSSSLQVLFRGTYWIRFWALLQKEEERPLVLEGCRTLECSAMEIFASNGWPFINRIACLSFFLVSFFLLLCFVSLGRLLLCGLWF